MLVLSRKSGECINIGDDIEVRVLDICGGRVRLGFSAPHDVNIRRQEIHHACTGQFQPWDECDAVDTLCAQR
jgi:carbon storage regulator